MTAYRRADGEPIAGEYRWILDLDLIDDDLSAPVELVEEVWILFSSRPRWRQPMPAGTCEVEDQEPCEEDAVAWARTPDGVWLMVCTDHQTRFAVEYAEAAE
jgi:hypothetical protein